MILFPVYYFNQMLPAHDLPTDALQSIKCPGPEVQPVAHFPASPLATIWNYTCSLSSYD